MRICWALYYWDCRELVPTLCVCVQDAMSEAVEGAELMLYAVSEKYKER